MFFFQYLENCNKILINLNTFQDLHGILLPINFALKSIVYNYNCMLKFKLVIGTHETIYPGE